MPRLLGHARLATIGDPGDLLGLQPVEAAGHLLAHNGTVRNWRTLTTMARTDSAALAERYAELRAADTPPAVALELTLKAAVQPTWVVTVLDATGVLVHSRCGLPLWRHEAPDGGRYFSSRRFGAAVPTVPGTVHTEAPQT